MMVVLGGLGSIAGAVVGAVALHGAARGAARRSTQYRLVVYALLLIVIMILRPQGLFGTRDSPSQAARAAAARQARRGAGAARTEP